MLAQEIIIGYLLDENNLDRTIDILYADDNGFDYAKVNSYIDDLYAKNCSKLSTDDKKVVAEYISKLYRFNLEVDELLLELAIAASKKDEVDPIIFNLDTGSFWTNYAIAVKKCLFTPTAQIKSDVYYKHLENHDTKSQRLAHLICFKAFNLDADAFERTKGSLLRELLPKLRKLKRPRGKKKYVNMVAKEAKKITIRYKAMNPRGSVFKEKSPKVVESFSKKIINEYLS